MILYFREKIFILSEKKYLIYKLILIFKIQIFFTKHRKFYLMRQRKTTEMVCNLNSYSIFPIRFPCLPRLHKFSSNK